jgi:hypothetical protein
MAGTMPSLGTHQEHICWVWLSLETSNILNVSETSHLDLRIAQEAAVRSGVVNARNWKKVQRNENHQNGKENGYHRKGRSPREKIKFIRIEPTKQSGFCMIIWHEDVAIIV